MLDWKRWIWSPSWVLEHLGHSEHERCMFPLYFCTVLLGLCFTALQMNSRLPQSTGSRSTNCAVWSAVSQFRHKANETNFQVLRTPWAPWYTCFSFLSHVLFYFPLTAGLRYSSLLPWTRTGSCGCPCVMSKCGRCCLQLLWDWTFTLRTHLFWA